jgi:hypothetical protein
MAKVKKQRRDGTGPPRHLSEASARLWSELVEEYAMQGDAAALAILTAGMEALDRCAEARAILAKEGLVSQSSGGVAKVHPAALVERDSKSAFLACMKALKLDIEPIQPRPGRPPGR